MHETRRRNVSLLTELWRIIDRYLQISGSSGANTNVGV